MELLNNFHYHKLFECVKQANKSILLCAPFVKYKTVHDIYNAKKKQAQVSLITNMNLKNFYAGASDVSALKIINSNKGKIFNFQSLHAKIYIFDAKYAIITSANLTPSGLTRNYEYGIFLDDPQSVGQVCDDFHKICQDERVGEVTAQKIAKMEEVLVSLPKPPHVKKLQAFENENDTIIDGKIDKSLVLGVNVLTGWKQSVFNALNSVDNTTFSYNDYKHLIPRLQKEHPKNLHVEDKIRQILQQLRDIGLVKFEGNGVYTKLWE